MFFLFNAVSADTTPMFAQRQANTGDVFSVIITAMCFMSKSADANDFPRHYLKSIMASKSKVKN